MNGVDPLWVISSTTDAEGRSTHSDPQWLALTGQTAAESLGYGWLDAIHSDDRPHLIEAMRNSLERRAAVRHEFRVRRKDGVYRWALGVAAPRYDETGAFLGYVGSMVEIHHRREIEESLRASEERSRLAHERLTAALRSSPIALFEQAGPDLRYEWILNPARRYRAEDVVGRTDHELLGPENGEILSAIKRRVIETGVPARQEVRLVTGGQLRWYDLSVEPRRSAGAVSGVFCAASDITERREADSALRRAQEALAIAVDAAQMGTWDIDLKVAPSKSRNLRHDRIFGYDEPLDVWTPDTTRQHILEEDRPVFDAAFAEAMRSGDFRVDARIRRRDGAVCWIALRGRFVMDAEGTPSRASGVTYDITEQKRVEQALKDADRRKDEFLAILGHELRNPLAPIQNGIQTLKRGLHPEAPPARRALVDMMQRQTASLVRLVDDLLELSRVNSGVIDLRRERADLALAVRDALEISEPLIEKKGHRVVTRLCTEPLVTFGDPMRLAQILTNLVSNAAKYTAPGGTIEIETRRDGDSAIIAVRDDGVGLGPDALPRVFDLFAQIDPPGTSEGGLGVGLALARKLAELHSGAIEARSRGLGEGAEFVVTLPIETAAAVADLGPSVTREAPPSLRLLVVDDNHDVADSMGLLLETFGAAIRVAYDGASGVEAAAEFKPDIAFVDIRMPGVDGYETARRLRARLGPEAPKLVALTGLGQDRDREGSRDAGFDLHLTKPVSIDALENLLRGRAAE